MKLPGQPDAAGSPSDWLRHARSDLALARLAAAREDVLPEQACFHAQQAAEKALKAVLRHAGIQFPLVHDIETLATLWRTAGHPLPVELTEAAALTPYAVAYRYPGQPDEVTASDAVEALDLATQAVTWAERVLGEEPQA